MTGFSYIVLLNGANSSFFLSFFLSSFTIIENINCNLTMYQEWGKNKIQKEAGKSPYLNKLECHRNNLGQKIKSCAGTFLLNCIKADQTHGHNRKVCFIIAASICPRSSKTGPVAWKIAHIWKVIGSIPNTFSLRKPSVLVSSVLTQSKTSSYTRTGARSAVWFLKFLG